MEANPGHCVGSTLDPKNPYSHFNLDNPDAGKFCGGRLFEGVDELGIQVDNNFRELRRRRMENGNWNAFWYDEDEDAEWEGDIGDNGGGGDREEEEVE